MCHAGRGGGGVGGQAGRAAVVGRDVHAHTCRDWGRLDVHGEVKP